MKYLFFLSVFFSCIIPYTNEEKKYAKREIEQVDFEPTIKDLSKDIKANQQLQETNDSILSSKLLGLISDNAIQIKKIDNLEKSNAAKTITIAGLLKDQGIKTLAITNLGNMNAAITVKVNALVKDQSVKTTQIINLKTTDSISTIKTNALAKENAAQAQLIKFLQDHFTSVQKQVTGVQVKTDSLQRFVKTYAMKPDTVYSFKFSKGVVGLNWAQVIKVIQAEILETAKP